MQNAHPLTQFANIEENSLTTTLLPQKRMMLSSHEFTSSILFLIYYICNDTFSL